MEDENQRFSRLLTAHLDKVKQQVKKFMEAACAGDIKLFKKLAKGLDRGKGLAATVASVKDGKERGALSFAATEGQLKMCKYLVEELKIDVNDRDKEGQTPVLCAAREGHTATVQYLIEKGADPATPSTSGAALHNAAGNGHIELVKLLLSKGVDVDLQSDAGTPLMWAAGLGQEDAVKVLLEHHANFDAQTGDDNMCPLGSAVAANSLPCVELLVKAGANVNVKTGEATRYGETTPLLIAAHNGNAEIVNCLLQAGADPNAADEDGNKPIHVAATRGNRAAVEALLAVTPQIQSVPEWSVDGVIEFMQSDYRRKQQESTEAGEEANYGANLRCLLTRLEDEFKGLKQERIIPKKDLPEVTPEAKKKAADAKAKGDQAFKRNDFPRAINAYAQAINFDPTDGTLFSNRSLCWLRLGQGESALVDAKACRELRPDWAKGYYRHGAALRLLQRFEEAANAFYRGIQIDPNDELITALQGTVAERDAEAAKEIHDMELELSCVIQELEST
ncbi:ankyrin-1-like isoform X1 [Solanum tuberosum]|uniref:ankyrin-1-like isoform X1 n=1 Tax=Solanum tuberosum TaxID=4113 RepID=UPI00073A52EF|nr:PREDICTED: ankyrin-1-like isoform X1 [Solanum tuberosum]